MTDQSDIPILTDLIEKGIEIKLSDLGLDDELDSGVATSYNESDALHIAGPEAEGVDPFKDNPELEQIIRRIFDEHAERAWEEIRLAIGQHLNK